MTQVADRPELVAIIRPSFTRICQSDKPDGCRAAVFNHMLYWIAKKAKGASKEPVQQGKVTWYESNEKITEDMSHTWGVCKVSKEVNELIRLGLIGRTDNQAWKMDRTKHFFFGKEQCAEFLQRCKKYHVCLQHIGLPTDILHLIYLSNAFDTSIECICEKHQVEATNISNASDISIKAVTQDSSQDSTEDSSQDSTEKEDTAHADSHTSVLFGDFLAVDQLIEPTCITVYLSSDTSQDQQRSKDGYDLKRKFEQKGHTIQMQFEREGKKVEFPPPIQKPNIRLVPIAIGTTKPTSPASGGKGKTPKAPPVLQLTLQGEHVLSVYETFKHRKAPRTDVTIKAANGLGEVIEDDALFTRVLEAVRDDSFLNERGVRTDLDFIYRKYDGYVDILTRPQEPKKTPQQAPTPTKEPLTPEQQAKLDKLLEKRRSAQPVEMRA